MVNQTEVKSEKIKTSQISSPTRIEELVYEGITYVKLMRAPQQFKFATANGKRDCVMWICSEADAKLPAKVVLVPEIT